MRTTQEWTEMFRGKTTERRAQMILNDMLGYMVVTKRADVSNLVCALSAERGLGDNVVRVSGGKPAHVEDLMDAFQTYQAAVSRSMSARTYDGIDAAKATFRTFCETSGLPVDFADRGE